MKNRISIFFCTFLLISCFSFTDAFSQKVKQERNVDTFDEISLNIPADLIIKQDAKQSIVIETEESIINEIKTIVKGDELIIKFKTKRFRIFNKKITIYISAAQFEELNISGSGDIINEGTIEMKDMELNISGSGDIVLNDLKVTEMEINVAGSGNVTLEGKPAKELEISVAGSGDVSAFKFPAKNVECSLAGSGDCEVTANESLNISIAGSGDVTYKGNAKINSSIVGSGSISSK